MAVAEPRPGSACARAKSQFVSVSYKHLPGLATRVKQRRDCRRAAQIGRAGELKGQFWLLHEPVDGHLGLLGRRRPGFVVALAGLESIRRQSGLPFDVDAGEITPVHMVAPVVSEVGKRRMEFETTESLGSTEILDKFIPWRRVVVVVKVRRLPNVYKTGRRCEEINGATYFEREVRKKRKDLGSGGFRHVLFCGQVVGRAPPGAEAAPEHGDDHTPAHVTNLP